LNIPPLVTPLPIFNGQDFQEESFFFYILSLEDKTQTLSQSSVTQQHVLCNNSEGQRFHYNVAEALNITAAELL